MGKRRERNKQICKIPKSTHTLSPFLVVPIPQPQVAFIPAPTFIPHQPSGGGSSSGALLRKKTVRRNIQLTPQGNLVIDIPVPDRVVKAGRFQTGDEFTHMRYTACTSDPNDFYQSGYALRQQEFNRQTELFVVVTMVRVEKRERVDGLG